jgi:IS4 transposase
MIMSDVASKLKTIVAVLLMFTFLTGLIPIIAGIAYKKSKEFNTSTVQVQEYAYNVYKATLEVIEQTDGLVLIKKDDEKRKVEAKKGDLRAKITVNVLGEGATELVVKADAGKDKDADRELSLRIVKRVCEQIGVKYEVIEE